MVVTKMQLQRCLDLSRETVKAFPSTARLKGMRRNLTEGEILAVCYIEAVMTLVAENGPLRIEFESDDTSSIYEP